MDEDDRANQCDPKDEVPSGSWNTSNCSQRREPQSSPDGHVKYYEPCYQTYMRSELHNGSQPRKTTTP